MKTVLPDNILLRIIIPVAGLVILAAGLIGMVIWSTSQWRLPEAERLESNIQRFHWATPECVAQEIRNPGYRNNVQNLRLCELEQQVAELTQRIEAGEMGKR